MMDGPPVTTPALWQATVILSGIAAAMVGSMCRLVSSDLFRRLRAIVVAVTFVVWLLIWQGMVTAYWEGVYSHFFAEGLRWWMPWLMALGFSSVSWVMCRVAQSAGRKSVLAFLVLGALLGPVTHAWAVFRGIVTKPPMLRGASPVAAIAVSCPEFAIYFSSILFLSYGLHRFVTRRLSASG